MRATRRLLERVGAPRLAGATLLALTCSAAACGLNTSGIDPSAGNGFGGSGQGSASATSAGGAGGMVMTVSSGGPTSSSTAGGDGGASSGGGGAGGDGFVCEGDKVFEDAATGHCYFYADEEVDKANWSNAQSGCEVWGGVGTAFLAAISSQDEFNFVLDQIEDMPDLWIGGRNLTTDVVDEYVWFNGETWSFTPTGLPLLPVIDKECLKLKPDKFDPKSCGEPHFYLCERHPGL